MAAGLEQDLFESRVQPAQQLKPTSVIGSAGFGWSGESCFFEGDTGAPV